MKTILRFNFFCAAYLVIIPCTFAFTSTSLLEPQTSQGGSSILSWEELKNVIKENIPHHKSQKNQTPLFLSLGESHVYQEHNYELYDELVDTVQKHWKLSNYKMCAEPISGSLHDSKFYNKLKNSASTYVEYKQSVSRTNFTSCYEDQYQTYVYYSGFHHQLPLAKIFPQSFVPSPVSTSWDQSIYSQSTAKGLSFSWIDYLVIESYALTIFLKSKPKDPKVYNEKLSTLHNQFERFHSFLKPVKNKRKKLLENLRLAVVPLVITNSSPTEQFHGGKHFFLINSTTKELSYMGQLLKHILKLPDQTKNALYQKLADAQRAHYFRMHFDTSKQNADNANCTLSGSTQPIHCSSQILTWQDTDEKRFSLVWQPKVNTLLCFQDDKVMEPNECLL